MQEELPSSLAVHNPKDSRDYYPPYCRGALYLLTPHTVGRRLLQGDIPQASLLLARSHDHPYLFIDDAFVTGFLVRLLRPSPAPLLPQARPMYSPILSYTLLLCTLLPQARLANVSHLAFSHLVTSSPRRLLLLKAVQHPQIYHKYRTLLVLALPLKFN